MRVEVPRAAKSMITSPVMIPVAIIAFMWGLMVSSLGSASWLWFPCSVAYPAVVSTPRASMAPDPNMFVRLSGPGRDAALSRSSTSFGVSEGSFSSMRATSPVMYADEKDVPVSLTSSPLSLGDALTRVPFPSGSRLMMPVAGAAMSIHGPVIVVRNGSMVGVVPPTDMSAGV